VCSSPRKRILEKKGYGHENEKPRSRLLWRILAAQPYALKRLDAFAAIVHCDRGQEIPNASGPAGHWYYVIAGAVRRCTIRSDGRRQIVDLMLPRDFFFISDSKKEGNLGQQEGGDDRGDRRGHGAGKLPWRAGGTAGGA
jgi:hypothetical protein